MRSRPPGKGRGREFWWVVGNEAVFRRPNSSTKCSNMLPRLCWGVGGRARPSVVLEHRQLCCPAEFGFGCGSGRLSRRPSTLPARKRGWNNCRPRVCVCLASAAGGLVRVARRRSRLGCIVPNRSPRRPAESGAVGQCRRRPAPTHCSSALVAWKGSFRLDARRSLSGRGRSCRTCRCQRATVPCTRLHARDRRGARSVAVRRGPTSGRRGSDAPRCSGLEGGGRQSVRRVGAVLGADSHREREDVAPPSPFAGRWRPSLQGRRAFARRVARSSLGYLVDPASSHMLVSKTKPCMSKYERFVL